MRISDYFSIYLDGKEMDIYQFLQSFNEDTFDEKWIDWDNVEQKFKVHLYLNEYDLEFPGTVDPEIISMIKDLVKRYRRYRKKERIVDEVVETGSFPVEKKDIFYYREYLNDELKDSKTDLVRSAAYAAAPIALSILTVLFGKYFIGGLEGTVDQTLFQFLGSAVGTVVSGLGTYVTLPFLTKSGLRDKFSDYKIANKKLKALNAHEEKLENKKDYLSFIQEQDDKDNKKVEVYKDKFLEEARDIADLIDSLPKERQKNYRDKVSLLIKEYQDKVNALIEKNKNEIVLGEAEDVWQIFFDLLPELNKIRFDIQEELDVISEKEKFNDEVESFQESLYNSYTDELTDSSVAHMKLG